MTELKTSQQNSPEEVAQFPKKLLYTVAFFIFSIGFIYDNEGRAIRNTQNVDQIASRVVSLKKAEVDPNHESYLVHVIGIIKTETNIKDPTFGVSAKALRLNRKVVMYQWKESNKDPAGQEVEYLKVWSGERIDSKKFKIADGHENPARMPYIDTSFFNQELQIGEFTLSPEIVEQMKQFEKLPLTDFNPASFPNATPRIVDGMIYVGDNEKEPNVGDVKVYFEVINPALVSVVASQDGSNLAPYLSPSGDQLMLLAMGKVSKETMLTIDVPDNAALIWALRLIGLGMIYYATLMLLTPISSMVKMIPYLGEWEDLGLAKISKLLTLILAFTSAGAAWPLHQPLLTLLLWGTAAGVGYKLFKRLHPEGFRLPEKTGVITLPIVGEKLEVALDLEEKNELQYFLLSKTKKYGPFNVEKIQHYLDSGKISSHTPCYRTGVYEKLQVKDIPGIVVKE